MGSTQSYDIKQKYQIVLSKGVVPCHYVCAVVKAWLLVPVLINSLAPRRGIYDFKLLIFKLSSRISILSISRRIALGRMLRRWFVNIGLGKNLSVVRPQTFTRNNANLDLGRHMASQWVKDVSSTKCSVINLIIHYVKSTFLSAHQTNL